MTAEHEQSNPSSHGIIVRACERFADAVKTALHDVKARHQLASELADLANYGQLDGVLGEAGFNSGQVGRLIADHAQAPRLLQAMTERLGVDTQHIDRPLMRQIQQTCSICAAQRRCRKWLRSGASRGYHGFCPNADLFDSMLGRAGGGVREEEAAAMLRPNPAAESEAEARKLGTLSQLPYV